MIKVLFLCHGNICRSPMAEFSVKVRAGPVQTKKSARKQPCQPWVFRAVDRGEKVSGRIKHS